MWHCSKYKYLDQWDRIESPEIDSHICGQFIFYEDAEAIKCRNAFPINDTETTGHGDGKKVKLTPSVHVTKKLTLSGSRT